MIVVTLAVAAVIGAVLIGVTLSDDGSSRQRTVAERGADVMPFDLEATTHVFVPTETGGIQTVVADDPTDSEQVALIRFHLRDEVERFRVGDFGDPATIHGQEMPGLAVLQANFDALETDYRDKPDGAEITYHSSDPAVVAALHDWFDAQLSDHGTRAQDG
ncbi:MAG: aspartate carbamoyltransferase [Acidimicrobiia bacterium]|nr:aspartate carbamoyltransferase [Acidimicrobiia bacterium]